MRNALPALMSHTVSLLENCSLTTAIGVAELVHAVQNVENASFLIFETLLIDPAIYLFSWLLLSVFGIGLALPPSMAPTLARVCRYRRLRAPATALVYPMHGK